MGSQELQGRFRIILRAPRFWCKVELRLYMALAMIERRGSRLLEICCKVFGALGVWDVLEGGPGGATGGPSRLSLRGIFSVDMHLRKSGRL